MNRHTRWVRMEMLKLAAIRHSLGVTPSSFIRHHHIDMYLMMDNRSKTIKKLAQSQRWRWSYLSWDDLTHGTAFVMADYLTRPLDHAYISGLSSHRSIVSQSTYRSLQNYQTPEEIEEARIAHVKKARAKQQSQVNQNRNQTRYLSGGKHGKLSRSGR